MTKQNQRRRLIIFVTSTVTIVALICGLTVVLIRSAIMGERLDPSGEYEGVEVRTLVELSGKQAYPEALTIGPDGNIYVAGFCTGDIWQVTPTGEITVWSAGGEDRIQAASGLAFGPDGALYVADHGDCNPRRSRSSLKRIAADGTIVETIGDIDEEDIPNSLAFDANGVLYLTDTQHGTVRWWDVERDRFLTWWSLPDVNDDSARPTGLAYDATTDSLIVADTQSGTLYRVPFTEERGAGEAIVLYQQDTRELDGLTLDDRGRIYLTFFDLNKVARFDPVTGDLIFLAKNFREPSDVAYLDGVVYVTNFDGLSLAPLVGWVIDPSLPFTVDAIVLPETLVD